MENTNNSSQANQVSDYRHLFDKALENLDRVCKEYKNGAICQKQKRTRKIFKTN